MELWTALADITPDRSLYYLALVGPGILGVLLAGWAVAGPDSPGLDSRVLAVVSAVTLWLLGLFILAPIASDRAVAAVPERQKETIASYLAEEYEITASPIKVRDQGASALGVNAAGEQVAIELEWEHLSTDLRDPEVALPAGYDPLTITIEPTLAQRADR